MPDRHRFRLAGRAGGDPAVGRNRRPADHLKCIRMPIRRFIDHIGLKGQLRRLRGGVPFRPGGCGSGFARIGGLSGIGRFEGGRGVERNAGVELVGEVFVERGG